MFTLHPSPTEINKGTLTPSCRSRPCRHHRHLPCRRLRLPLRLLPRLALVEGVHRQLAADQKGLSGAFLMYSPRPMVRLGAFGNRSDSGRREELFEREFGVDPDVRLWTPVFSHFGPQSARKQESRQNLARNRFSAATETESNGL